MSRFGPDNLSALLLEIHQSAVEPANWPAAINHIADAIGAQSANLMVIDLTTGGEVLGLLERQDPEAHRVYMRDYFLHDIRVPRMTRTLPQTLIRDRDMWTAAERQSSPLYQDYQRAHRLYEITGANLSAVNHLIWCGFARDEERPFEDDSLHILRLVLPHVRQCIRHQLERASLTAQRNLAWQNSGKAILLLGTNGRLHFCNTEAEELARGNLFSLAGGRLTFTDSRAQEQLAHTLAVVKLGLPVPSNCEALLAVDQTTGAQIGLRLIATEHRADTALLILLSPLNQGSFSADEIERFATLFSLTPAETRVAAAVVSGVSLNDFAAELSIRADTVRKQLKSVLAKAGCHSQKDLIRMVERFCFVSLR